LQKDTDCIHIQKQWCEQFEKEYGKEQRWEIKMRLCMAGSRVERYLGKDEVEIEEGWICKIA